MSILKEIALLDQHAECLVSAQELEGLLASLARQITAECAEQNPVILCVMTGALVVVGKLLPLLNFPLELDYIHATRYQGETSGGELVWKQLPTVKLENRTVIIIDDILDEGVTMHRLIEHCSEKKANRIYSAVLIDKMIARPKATQANFVGIELEDKYLFGFGMDYKGYCRNADGIFACPDNLEELICQH